MNPAPRDPDRIARALLTQLAVPADPVLPGLLAVMDPGQVLACIRSGTVPARIADGLGETAGLRPLLGRWRGQLASFPADGGIAAARRAGIRLICPSDDEWPVALADLGAGPAHCGHAASQPGRVLRQVGGDRRQPGRHRLRRPCHGGNHRRPGRLRADHRCWRRLRHRRGRAHSSGDRRRAHYRGARLRS